MNYKLPLSKKLVMVDVIYWTVAFSTSLFLSSAQLYASDFKTGFENLTSSYLMPLSGAVAGCAFITFIILSYFKQDEYQKKVAGVLGLTVISSVGLSLIQTLIQNFS